MKKFFIFFILSSVGLLVSGCGYESNVGFGDATSEMQYVERDANGMVIDKIKKVDNVTGETNDTKTNSVNKEPTGMTKVLIINKETKRPVPGIGISIPYSSQMFYANNLGQAFIPYSYESFSIPKINNYYSAGTIENSKDKKEIVVELQPEETSGDVKVEYLTGFGKPSEDKSTYIYGTIKNSDGSPIINESVVVLKSGLNTKTDQNGNYKLNVVGESNSYRLYLPNIKNSIYYQVDIFKGYTLKIDIKI